MTHAQLSDRGRSLVRAIREAEQELARIWREPFETYAPKPHMDWDDRQRKAAKVYKALLDQV